MDGFGRTLEMKDFGGTQEMDDFKGYPGNGLNGNFARK